MGESYTLLDVLGRGSTGTVHRAEDRAHPGRIVAVKRIDGAAVDATLHREVAALTRLAHPSIVRIVDVLDDADGAGLVTPYLAGGSLADRLAAHGGLPAAAVADLGARLGDALAAAHDAGVIHRDVKPANVLYDAEEQPLLADFGAALLEPGGDGWIVGSATYLDPAMVVDGATPDVRSDQYGLAVTLYETLAGVPPYAAPTVDATLRAADRGVHVPLVQHAPDAPHALCDAIERGLSRDPSRRFATVQELASRLAEVRTQLALAPGEPVDGPTGTPTWRPRTAEPAPSPTPGAGPSGPPPPPVGPAGDGGEGTPLPDTRPDARPGTRSGTRSAAGPQATTRFGPAAPTPPVAAVEPEPRAPRPALLVAAVVVLLVPIGLVVAWLVGGDRGPVPGDEGEVVPLERADLPACADAPAAPDADEVLDVDLTGEGCTTPLGWDPDANVLTLPRAEGEPARFELGEPGDVLLVGAWECDGVDAPALYRPSTGQVFEFRRFGDPDGEVESRPARDSGVTDGEPEVARDADGCDRIEVAPG